MTKLAFEAGVPTIKVSSARADHSPLFGLKLLYLIIVLLLRVIGPWYRIALGLTLSSAEEDDAISLGMQRRSLL